MISFSGMGQTSLTLQQAKTSAIENNKKVKSAHLEIEKAKQMKKEAFTNYFPKVSITAGAYHSFDPLIDQKIDEVNLPVYDGNPASLAAPTQFAYFPGMEIQRFQHYGVGMANLVQPVYTGGRLANGNKLAKLNVDVKELQKTVAERDVALSAEEQYWQLLSLEEKMKLMNQYDQLLDTISVQVNDAFNAGLIIKNDVLKVKLQQNEISLNREKLSNGMELLRRQFCLTIGIDYSEDLDLTEEISVLKKPVEYHTISDSAVMNRPEYDLLNQSLRAADLQKKMTMGEYLPQFAVGASGFVANSFEKNAKSTTNGLVYATLSIPVTDWWGGSHKLKQLELDKQIAQNTFDETTDLLVLQTEKFRKDMDVLYTQIEIQKENIAQAEENARVSQMGYTNGVITMSDMLEAQTILYESKVNLKDLQIQYKMATSRYVEYTNQ